MKSWFKPGFPISPSRGRLVLIAALATVPLSACGFHPLYGGANGAMGSTLSTIYVEPMQDRLGYELRNTMIDLLNGPGSPAGATYHLALSLTQTSQGVALEDNAAVTRYNNTLKVTYTLTDLKGTVVTKGVETGLSDYNVLPSFAQSTSNPIPGSPVANYGTLAAQQDADKRAADDIAERIQMDLNVFFAKK